MQDAWRTSVVAKVLAAGGAYEKASEIRDSWTFSVQPSLKNLHGTQATFEASDGTTVFKSDDEILRFLNLYTPRYKCRQRVRARYRRGPTYYAATVQAVRDNGTYDVARCVEINRRAVMTGIATPSSRRRVETNAP